METEKPKPYCDGGPRTPGKEPDGVRNCKKCHGRGFVWRKPEPGEVLRRAVPCSRCGGS